MYIAADEMLDLEGTEPKYIRVHPDLVSILQDLAEKAVREEMKEWNRKHHPFLSKRRKKRA